MALFSTLKITLNLKSTFIKSLIHSALFFLCPILLMAQSGTITGLIIDESETPIEFATVSIFNQEDSTLVSGGISNGQGIYKIEKVPHGKFYIKYSFIGLTDFYKENIILEKRELKIPTVTLSANEKVLKEMVITGNKEVFKTEIDKRIFDVSESTLAEGGSAVDILETIPSVSVDIDGNIEFRGSGGVIILIDGRPSGLSGEDRNSILSEIPASAIESIEFITNPSSKYDAEGMAGIINIKLKKNKLIGYNGNTSVSVGTRDKYNASLGLNFRNEKFNVFANYSYRYEDKLRDGFNNRVNDLSGERIFLNQDRDGLNNSQSHILRTGADFFLNDNNTIGFAITYNNSDNKRREDLFFETLNQNQTLLTAFDRNNIRYNDRQTLEGVVSYNKTFKEQKGRELSASISLSKNTRDDLYELREELNFPIEEMGLQQNNLRETFQDIIVAQVDYVHPINKKSKVETGLKTTIRDLDGDFVFDEFDEITGGFEENLLLRNTFGFQEQVHAAYGNFGQQIDKFGYQVGLRAEQTFMSTEQRTTSEKFTNNYFDLFPSVFVTYNLKSKNQLQLNYSKRINRPSAYALNPFIDFSDPLNLSAGNPKLRPEYTDAYEGSYLRTWEKFFLTSSLYYRKTNDVIQRVTFVDANNVALRTRENIASRENYGFEFIARNTINNWWNVTTTLNLYRNVIIGDVPGTFNNDNFTWSLNVMTNASIPKIAQIQVMGSYMGPRATAQGLIKPIYFMNIGLKREILNDKGTISVNLTDVFNTRRFRMDVEGPGFEQEMLWNWETQVLTATFTYKFGNLQTKESRQKRERMMEDGGDDMF